MKAMGLFFAAMFYGMFTFAQTGDSLLAEMHNWHLFKKADGSQYVTDSSGQVIFSGLRFARPLGFGLQVIDAGNRAFFMDKNLQRSDSLEYFIGVCGTVPHYVLRIKETKTHFVLMEDETFYDYGNRIPAKPVARVPKTEADRVFFINGETTFFFTGNYGFVNLATPRPRTLFYQKNGKIGVWGDSTGTRYDEFLPEGELPKVKTQGLTGYFGVTKTKYKTLEPFTYFLARYELPDGSRGYVDSDGNEYADPG